MTMRALSIGLTLGLAAAAPAMAQNGPVATTGHVAGTTVRTAGSVANGVTGPVSRIIP